PCLDFRNLGTSRGIFGVAKCRVAVGVPAAAGAGIGARAIANEHKIELYARADRRRGLFAAQPCHRLAEQLAIKLEADADNVTALLGSEKIPGAAQFEIAHRDPETGTKLAVLAHRRQALAGYFQQARVAVEEKVGIGLVLETPYSPAELVELRKTKAVCALDEDGVAVRNI